MGWRIVVVSTAASVQPCLSQWFPRGNSLVEARNATTTNTSFSQSNLNRLWPQLKVKSCLRKINHWKLDICLGVLFSLTDQGHPYWLIIWQYPLILWWRVLPFDLNCCRKQYCLWNWGSRAKKPLRSGKNRARAFSACFEYACCEPPLLLLDPFSPHWQSTWPGSRAGEFCKNIWCILEHWNFERS